MSLFTYCFYLIACLSFCVCRLGICPSTSLGACKRFSASERVKTKIETQPKPSSKRIENAALASFFGRLWGGVHDPVHLKRPFTIENPPKSKIEAQPKPLSKRIENVSFASFFGRLWRGLHDPVHLNRPFTMEHCQTDAIMIRSVLNNALTIIARDL